jgi:C-terminal processing protease CtpA/Prc
MKMTFLFILVTLITGTGLLGQIPNTLTTSDKVYGLSKFWQEVNYNFVYFNKVDRNLWDNRYKELITIVQNTKNDYEYYRELQKFCALLKDGHTNVYLPENIKEMNSMFGEYRMFIENIDNKPIITRTNISKKDEIPIGSEIIEVNGKTTQKYIDENVAPYISSSTDYILKDWSASGLLRGLEGEKYLVKIKRPDNKIVQLNLTHKFTEEKEVFPSFEPDKQLLDFKWVNKSVAYIALNSFANETIDSLFIGLLPELYKAKGLIIDLRYNGGGSTEIGKMILKYLTNDTVFYGARNLTRQHIATYKAWGTFFTENDTLSDKPEWGMTKEDVTKFYLMSTGNYYYKFPYEAESIKLEAKRIVIPTVILIGHNTASAAEDFLILADNQKHMIKVGQNSYGSTGQPLIFDLPGGGSARVCTKQDTYPDGREFVGYGIKPDIEVIPTLNDYLNKKDPALDKSIEYLKQKMK